MKIKNLLFKINPNWFSNFSTCDVLTQEETGLPVIIRYDGWHTWKNKYKHTLLIQNEYKGSLNKDYFILSIENNPKILLGNCKISDGELNKIKRFIFFNKNNLIKLIDFDIEYEDFIKGMIK